MNVILHWGNVIPTIETDQIEQLLEKNIQKIKRLLKRIDLQNVRLEISLKYDSHKKVYKTTLKLFLPGDNHYITERSFTLTNSLTQAVRELKRKIRKQKEKRITLKRKKIV